jgi:hypothetical protein
MPLWIGDRPANCRPLGWQFHFYERLDGQSAMAIYRPPSSGNRLGYGSPPPEHVEPDELFLGGKIALERVLRPAPVAITGNGVSFDSHGRQRALHVEGDPKAQGPFLKLFAWRSCPSPARTARRRAPF